MHFAIKFAHLNYPDFVDLKGKIVLNALKLSPSLSAFGENIYSGNTSDNERCFLFEYHNNQKPAASFIISSSGKNVFYYAPEVTSPQSVETLIRGNITKFCLQEQGYFCLHASAMCVDDKVVLFMGQKGAGKSTLATYFHLRGHAIWCDDYAMLHNENSSFSVSQGETSLKINPDIVNALTIPGINLKRVFELPADWRKTAASDIITQKYYFRQQTSPVDLLPRPVAAIFFINPRVPAPEKIITTIKKTAALSVLMDEILLPGINSKQYLKTYFESAMSFLEIVPSYNIYPPDNITRIQEVYNSILETVSMSQHETSI